MVLVGIWSARRQSKCYANRYNGAADFRFNLCNISVSLWTRKGLKSLSVDNKYTLLEFWQPYVYHRYSIVIPFIVQYTTSNIVLLFLICVLLFPSQFVRHSSIDMIGFQKWQIKSPPLCELLILYLCQFCSQLFWAIFCYFHFYAGIFVIYSNDGLVSNSVRIF